MAIVRSSAFLLLLSANLLAKDLKNDLYGQHLLISASNFPPTIWHVRNSTGAVVAFKGLSVEIIQWLAQRLHFRYTIVPMFDNFVGTKVNGSFTNFLATMARREVDLNLGPGALDVKRYETMDYVVYLEANEINIMTQYPEKEISQLSIIQPFDQLVWGILFLTIVAVSGVTTFIIYFRATYLKRQSALKELDDVMMYYFGTMTAQGGYYRSRYISIGLVAGFWCFLAFVFVNAYNSMLTSYLSAHYQAPVVNSLEQLSEKANIKVFTIKGSAMEVDILRSFSKPMQILANRYRKCSNCPSTSLDEIGQRVIDGGAVAYLPFVFASNLIRRSYESNQKCMLTVTKPVAIYHAFMSTPKGSPYMEELNRESLWALAFGLYAKWKNRGYYIPPQCSLKYNSKGVAVEQYNVPLKMKQLHLIFYFLLFGYSAAFFVFVFERLYFRWTSKQKPAPTETRPPPIPIDLS